MNIYQGMEVVYDCNFVFNYYLKKITVYFSKGQYYIHSQFLVPKLLISLPFPPNTCPLCPFVYVSKGIVYKYGVCKCMRVQVCAHIDVKASCFVILHTISLKHGLLLKLKLGR